MPTANDPLAPGRVLGALKKVKGAIEEIAAREKEAMAERDRLIVAARRNARVVQEQAEEENVRKRTQIEGRIKADEEAVVIFHERRKEWIRNCHHRATESLAQRVSEQRDRMVGRAQGEVMRRREELRKDLRKAQEELEQVRNKVSAEVAEADRMLAEGMKALSGFWPAIGGKLRGQGVEVSEVPQGDLIVAAAGALTRVKSLPAAKVFRFLPLPALLVVAIGGMAAVSGKPAEVSAWAASAGIACGVVVVVWLGALVSVWGATGQLARAILHLRMAGASQIAAATEQVGKLEAEMGEMSSAMSSGLSETLRESQDEFQERIREGRAKLEAQLARVMAKEEALHAERLARREKAAAERLGAFAAEVRETSEKLEGEGKGVEEEAREAFEATLAEIGAKWEEDVTRPLDELGDLADRQHERFPEWSESMAGSWTPPADAEEVVPFATLRLSGGDLAGQHPENAALDLPKSLETPLNLGFPEHGSVLFEGDMAAAAGAMSAVAMRILSTRPAGQAAFTFIDPVGLGRDFAGLMHLADYEESLVHGRIWTQQAQIDERLAELGEHVEKVIQMYLRNEFETISDYNRQAGEIAEKYRFVFVAGFPTNFGETALQRLRSLAASGARCGVFLFIQMDKPPADKGLEEELRRSCLCLKQDGDAWRLAGQPGEVVLNAPPEGALETKLVHRFGKASVDSNRVEVPFSNIAPEGALWTEKTGDELRVPIGRTGAKKMQYLSIGKGTRQHALIAGKTGSGKSTLFHVMITNLALYCSPEEVEFYLVDFKKGVEFKCYGSKKLPHARVVAIESDREFGLSVLRRVDEELRERGERFRECGAQDVAGYRKATGKPLPRTLLLIDEFQEFFTEDDAVGQEASLLLDRIVRQGRAFGIHAILGSQTLGGAYTLARATLGQMVIRIALQCNEADAYLIMDDDNPAPRLLTRPGEGIYNDNAGALAANSPFQTVWLTEEERNAHLDEVAALAKERGLEMPAPVVFEGNAPADIRDNEKLSKAKANPPSESPKVARAWLGAPNAIKGPTEAVFRRQSGANLMAVGQGEERMKALMEAAMVSLSAQYPKDGARFVIFDTEGEDGTLAKLAGSLPQSSEVHVPGDLAAAMAGLEERLKSGDGESVYVLIRDLHRFKALREEDEFKFSFDDDASSSASPAKVFQDLVREGSSAGIHLIVSLDTWSNVGRWIPRKALADFQMRVLFQMSANDSSAMIDSPAAGNLGLHRALLYDEAMGTIETFRPYARVE